LAIPLPDVLAELEERLARMGFELVEAGWVGSAKRPILRIRMDLPDSVPGEGGVSVDQCAEVSRALEPWLDQHPEVPERYVLEVSSPGVERPLTRPRDWERFSGQQAVVKSTSLSGALGSRIEGEILGVEGGEGEELKAALRLPSGERIVIPLDEVQKAHLVFRWD
jgi:ribosome maturation factor RimP